jgi:hypothetical protein
MTTTAIRGDCEADPRCAHIPYFAAKLVTPDGADIAAASVKLCAIHLGDVVQDLADWARNHGITEGMVIVTISSSPHPVGAPRPGDTPTGDFAFGSIPLSQ